MKRGAEKDENMAAPVSRLESDQSTDRNTHAHKRASLEAVIRADMLLILLLLEHTLDRQQVNQITGYHTAAEHTLDRAVVCWHQNVCTHIVLIFRHYF